MTWPARLVVVLSLLLSGCAGVGTGPADEAATATATPAPVPDLTPTPTRTPPPVDGDPVTGAGELAPGLTAAGVHDAVALSRAHLGILRGQSVTVVRTTTVRYGNGTVRHLDERYLLGADRDRSLVEVRLGDATVTYWTDGRERLTRQERDGTVTYEAGSRWPAPGAVLGSGVRAVYRRSFLGLLVAAADARVTRAAEADYRVTANVDTLREAESPFGLDPDPGRLSLLVDEMGLVVGWDLRYRATDRDGTPVAVTTRLRHVDVGTTVVERPVWYGAARARTDSNATATPA